MLAFVAHDSRINLIHSISDGTPSVVTNKFLRVVPDSCTFESRPPFRRKRIAIWPPSKLRWSSNQGTCLTSLQGKNCISSLQPDPKLTKKTFTLLQSHFAYLGPRSNRGKSKQTTNEEFVGEYQALMEQEFLDFVLFEVPWIVN